MAAIVNSQNILFAGNEGGGMTSVIHDSNLSGEGTTESPLGLNSVISTQWGDDSFFRKTQLDLTSYSNIVSAENNQISATYGTDGITYSGQMAGGWRDVNVLFRGVSLYATGVWNGYSSRISYTPQQYIIDNGAGNTASSYWGTHYLCNRAYVSEHSPISLKFYQKDNTSRISEISVTNVRVNEGNNYGEMTDDTFRLSYRLDENDKTKRNIDTVIDNTVGFYKNDYQYNTATETISAAYEYKLGDSDSDIIIKHVDHAASACSSLLYRLNEFKVGYATGAGYSRLYPDTMSAVSIEPTGITLQKSNDKYTIDETFYKTVSSLSSWATQQGWTGV